MWRGNKYEQSIHDTLLLDDILRFTFCVFGRRIVYLDHLHLFEYLEKTMTTQQKDFLAHVKAMCRYWDDLPDKDMTQLSRLEGLAFSILVAIDGESTLSSYTLRPIQEDGTEGEDISGSLHDLLKEV